jgi:hypothetical protein
MEGESKMNEAIGCFAELYKIALEQYVSSAMVIRQKYYLSNLHDDVAWHNYILDITLLESSLPDLDFRI